MRIDQGFDLIVPLYSWAGYGRVLYALGDSQYF